jgi:hypothetical protein
VDHRLVVAGRVSIAQGSVEKKPCSSIIIVTGARDLACTSARIPLPSHLAVETNNPPALAAMTACHTMLTVEIALGRPQIPGRGRGVPSQATPGFRTDRMRSS